MSNTEVEIFCYISTMEGHFMQNFFLIFKFWWQNMGLSTITLYLFKSWFYTAKMTWEILQDNGPSAWMSLQVHLTQVPFGQNCVLCASICAVCFRHPLSPEYGKAWCHDETASPSRITELLLHDCWIIILLAFPWGQFLMRFRSLEQPQFILLVY